MKSGISKTKNAFAALKRGEYQQAISLYNELSNLLGADLFRANIQICDNRLSGAPSTSNSSTIKLTNNVKANLDLGNLNIIKQTQEDKKPYTETNKKTNPDQKTITCDTLRTSTLELSDQMVWNELSVQQGDEVFIRTSVTYHCEDGAKRRKAVIVVSAFDKHGKEIDFSCGQLAKSRHLQGYFKYLNCTSGQLLNLHSFKIPSGAARIKIGLCRFNATATDRISVDLMEVDVKPRNDARTSFTPPSLKAAELSMLGWPEHTDNGRPYVIGIMDEFTTGCFEKELNLIQPRPDNWYALSEKYSPSFFFIESAWKGNGGSWQYRVADYASKPGPEIAHITEYALQRKIPTVFWNKEDPVHHQKFMCSAELADHIFTTDANMCDSYRKHTGNSNVHALPFAAQPDLHKPASLSKRLARSCFAGSWYGDRHAERGQAMRWLLQAANRHGLDIYDRNHGTGAFPFPDEYHAGIKGSLPYKDLCEKYSHYRVFLNVNSVIDSPTMFSRRVFELMASGTPVVSTYARGIEELFESDAVWLVHSEDEAEHAIKTLLTDDIEWRRRSLAGIREVFSRHTYAHRLNYMFEKIGLNDRIKIDPEVTLLSRARNSTELSLIINAAEQQSYQFFKIIIETTNIKTPPTLPHNVEIVKEGYLESSSFLKKSENFGIIGWISPSAKYGSEYLRDLVNAMLYEPKASGWAKALQSDAFNYETQSVLCASLWRSDIFIEQHANKKPTCNVKSPKLFCIDTDEFSLEKNVTL